MEGWKWIGRGGFGGVRGREFLKARRGWGWRFSARRRVSVGLFDDEGSDSFCASLFPLPLPSSGENETRYISINNVSQWNKISRQKVPKSVILALPTPPLFPLPPSSHAPVSPPSLLPPS